MTYSFAKISLRSWALALAALSALIVNEASVSARASSIELLANGNFEALTPRPGVAPPGWEESQLVFTPASNENGVNIQAGWNFIVIKDADIIRGGAPSLVASPTQNLENRFVWFGLGNRPNAGFLAQRFETVPGQLYRLSYDATAAGFAQFQQLLRAQVTDVSSGTSLFDTTETLAPTLDKTFGWRTFTYQFRAKGTSAEVSFANLFVATPVADGKDIDALLDNVSVVAVVPEPASWAMFIAGFALVGVAVRQSKRPRKQFQQSPIL